MKHADDEVNERLKKALAERFKNIHDEPDPALGKIILGSINRRSRCAKSAGLLLTLFLCIGISIAVDDENIFSLSHGVSHRFNKTQTHQAVSDSKLKNQKEQFNVNADNYYTRDNISPNPKKTKRNSSLTNQDITETHLTNSLSDQPVANAKMIDDLALLDNNPFNYISVLRLPTIKKFGNKTDPVSTKSQWNLVLGLTPMNTSQVLRIAPPQQATYQNFSFPANFTREKVAYKFQAGIENRGFQLLINYSQLRQFFDYELATKDFVLDKQGNPVRKGLHQELNTTLHFMGAGLRKNFELNSLGLRDYVINTGIDFSKELSSGQTALWGNAGIGKQIRIDKNTSIIAGPYLEYSLNKLATDQTGLSVQPYQIGLSMILKYKINPKN